MVASQTGDREGTQARLGETRLATAGLATSEKNCHKTHKRTLGTGRALPLRQRPFL